jgi:hypothetical protein
MHSDCLSSTCHIRRSCFAPGRACGQQGKFSNYLSIPLFLSDA